VPARLGNTGEGGGVGGGPQWKPPYRDTETKLENVKSPRWGPRVAPGAGHSCVALSLALFALGGADPAGRFCLRTLSFGRLTWGPFWIRFPYPLLPLRHSGHDVRAVREACKCGFTAPFTALCMGSLLHLLGCDTVGL
jgi:hypothetical protein